MTDFPTEAATTVNTLSLVSVLHTDSQIEETVLKQASFLPSQYLSYYFFGLV